MDVACFADPRFKNMPFLDKNEYDQLQKDVLEHLMIHSEDDEHEPQVVEQERESWEDHQDEPPPKKYKTGLGKLLSDVYYRPVNSKPKPLRENVVAEVERYVAEEPLDLDSNGGSKTINDLLPSAI